MIYVFAVGLIIYLFGPPVCQALDFFYTKNWGKDEEPYIITEDGFKVKEGDQVWITNERIFVSNRTELRTIKNIKSNQHVIYEESNDDPLCSYYHVLHKEKPDGYEERL